MALVWRPGEVLLARSPHFAPGRYSALAGFVEAGESLEDCLADGKERSIQHMTATAFWSADGRPMSAAQSLESLFGALPDFFKDEDQLRAIWSAPDTRKTLLAGLADKGFGRDALGEMQRVIEAEKSDLFDVLAYVAFAIQP